MKKKDFKDDGRQIADMSDTYQSWYGLRMNRKKKSSKPASNEDSNVPEYRKEPELSKKETRQIILNAILAALVIGIVFIGLAFLALLFITKVWLR